MGRVLEDPVKPPSLLLFAPSFLSLTWCLASPTQDGSTMADNTQQGAIMALLAWSDILHFDRQWHAILLLSNAAPNLCGSSLHKIFPFFEVS